MRAPQGIGPGTESRHRPKLRAGKSRMVILILACLFATPTSWVEANYTSTYVPTLSRDKLLLVVTANVKEQLAHDARGHIDMRNFVDRVAGFGWRTAPDVILLQQVNPSSTEWIRRALTEKTTYRYRTAVGPATLEGFRPGNPVLKEIAGGTAIKRDDSAILVNTKTTDVLARGKHILRQPRKTASRQPIHQVIPWAKLVEKAPSGKRLRMIMPSIHYPKPSAFTTRRVDRMQKAKWSERLSRTLKRRINDKGRGDSRTTVLAGDFNATECLPSPDEETRSCPKTVFWKRMRGLGYTSALRYYGWRGHSRVQIDHIFTDSFVSDSRFDGKFNGYSDHGIMMAWLEDEDLTPPTPPSIHCWNLTPENHPELVFPFFRRPISWDRGSGVSHYLLHRAGEQMEDPTFLGKIDEVGSYLDSSVDLSDGRRYHYQLKAVDRAGNATELGSRRIVEIDGSRDFRCRD